jgi:signal transduction histidine kinase/CheY-like chemotaxis protein/ABC-type amino acid transport substrate-binding protein/HPt (histidine-containing phosphotransfer) domain-containing protein
MLAYLPTVSYLIREYALTGLRLAGTVYKPVGTAVMMQKDAMLLRDIIQKALGSISEGERRAIESRWITLQQAFKSPKAQTTISLTGEERTWLDAHPIVRVHNESNFPPFNFTENSQPMGFSIDYMNLLARKLGLEVDYVSGPDWDEFMDMIKNRDIDIMLNITSTSERRENILFTSPYLRLPNVLASRSDDAFNSMSQLTGKTVATVDGFWQEGVLRRDFPEIKIVSVANTNAALEAVASGKADATLGRAAVLNYLITKNSITGVSVSVEIDLGLPEEMVETRIGVRMDWPLLRSALVKAMRTVTVTEFENLQIKWQLIDKGEAEELGITTATATSTESSTSTSASGDRLTIQPVAALQIGLTILLFVVIVLVISRFLRRTQEEHDYKLESVNVRRAIMILNGLLIALVISLAWLALDKIKTKVQEDMRESLETVLQFTRETLTIWADDQIYNVARIAAISELVSHVEALIEMRSSGGDLADNPHLILLREFFRQQQGRSTHIGFSVVAPDGINVASIWDDNIGSVSVLQQLRPELLQKILAGESVMVPPLVSDVVIPNTNNITGLGLPPAMFFAAPIRDNAGSVIAVLALQFDPHDTFSQINQLGRIGESGETYSFDRDGNLISESRFLTGLKQIGLVEPNGQSILSIRISDPGDNLAEGFQSEVERDELPLTVMAESATDRQNGANMEGYRDYRGVPVIGAWLWIDNLQIGMTSEIDLTEAMDAYYTARTAVIAILSVMVFLSTAFTIFTLVMSERTRRVLKDSYDKLELRVNERTQELQESEEQLVTAKEEAEQASSIIDMTLQNMNQGIIMVDSDLNLLVYNDGLLNSLGLTREQAENCQTFDDLVRLGYKPDDPGFKRSMELATSGKKKVYEAVQSDGKIIEVRQNPLNSGGFVRTYTDITERKQAEAILQFRLELEQMVSVIPNYFSEIADVDAAIDETLQDMGKLTSSQRVSLWQVSDDRSSGTMTHEWCAEGVESQIQLQQASIPIAELKSYRQIRQGNPFYVNDIYQLSSEDKDVTTFLEELGITSYAALPIMEENNLVAFYTLNEPQRLNEMDSPDISLLKIFGDSLHSAIQRREAESALMEAKDAAESASKIAQTTLENMGQGIMMTDSDLNLLVYNDRLLNPLGLTREQAKQCQTFEDLVRLNYKPDDPGFKRSMELAKSGKEKVYEAALLDGKIIEIRQNPIADGGLVRTYTDITDRKVMEQEIREAKDAAEAATKAKATFLASMSHEIRTPMNGVIGMVDLLRQTELKGDQKQMLQTIGDSGQSLLTIINDILDFSKIEAGKLDLESIPLSLTDVVEGSVQTIAANATKKGLRLITYVDPTLPQFVTGDPVRIRQIIINLGGNAIKFTEKGQVVIRAEQVGNNVDDKITIRFSVIDQGIGISEEGQAKLFQAFSQVEASTTRQFGGTGLGLTICKMLTEMMGGEIGVNSTLGEGAEFYSIIPFDQSDKQIENRNVVDLSDLRLLLVNSDPAEQAILRDYLEYWKLTVDVSDALEDVVDRCQAALDEGRPYDVVVLGPQWPREEIIPIGNAVNEAESKTRLVFLIQGTRQRARIDSEMGVFVDVNPLRRAAFISAVAIAVSRESPEVHYEEEVEDMKSTGEALTVEEAREQGTLILVAEDNATNRDVIGRQLTLLGYTCEMAEDGELALAAWRSNDYAILLTDCNMPNMDGFELTKAMRQDEEGTNTHATIVAITANALQGEAERCLAEGMDDYMSKPIDIKELREKLNKWMPQAKDINKQAPQKKLTKEEDTDNEPTSKVGNGPIDESTLKDMFGDDPEMFKEILVDFIAPSKAIIKEIQSGFEQNSAEEIKQGAHKLKSSALSIGAIELGELCRDLEEAGKNDDWDVIENGTPKLEELMHQVEEYISQL